MTIFWRFTSKNDVLVFSTAFSIDPYQADSYKWLEGALVQALAEQHELKTKVCKGLLESLSALAKTEVKKNGIFTLPGLCRIKTRVKPATKAGVRMMFGEEKKVKAKPARTVIKAFPVAALKAQI